MYSDKLKPGSLNIDQIFFIDKYKNDSYPWVQIAKKVCRDIENIERVKDQFELLKEKYNHQVIANQ